MESTRLEAQRVLAVKLHNSFKSLQELLEEANGIDLRVDLYVNKERTEYLQQRRLGFKTLAEL